MSLHYLLDGYNILHQLPVFNQGSREAQRRDLIRFIEQSRPQGSLRNKVIIFFDGRAGIGQSHDSSCVDVRFAGSESADEAIKKTVAQFSNKKNIVVITDDRAVQYAVRALGAKVLSVKNFIGVKSSPARGRKKILPIQDKTLPKNDEMMITAEMKRIWLNRKRGNKR